MIINIYLPNGCPYNKKIIHNNVSPNVSTEWILRARLASFVISEGLCTLFSGLFERDIGVLRNRTEIQCHNVLLLSKNTNYKQVA